MRPRSIPEIGETGGNQVSGHENPLPMQSASGFFLFVECAPATRRGEAGGGL
jgi:hypothetical protein